jgi:hypothetical protein
MLAMMMMMFLLLDDDDRLLIINIRVERSKINEYISTQLGS